MLSSSKTLPPLIKYKRCDGYYIDGPCKVMIQNTKSLCVDCIARDHCLKVSKCCWCYLEIPKGSSIGTVCPRCC